jgi:phosphohistidine phosphatase
MARQLWLLRHADAEPHGTRPDAERRLTGRGERQARLAGLALARMGAQFQGLLTSPRERSLRTATLAARALGDGGGCGERDIQVRESLAGGFDAREALAEMAGLAADGWLLAVGHEPDFSSIVGDLTGARIDLKKGGLAVVRIEGPGGELLALLRPRELALIAEPDGG